MRRRRYLAVQLLSLALIACCPAPGGAQQKGRHARVEGVVAVLGIPEETEVLAAQLTRPKPVKVQGLDFVSGELRGARVVLARVGFGKVNAALAATLLIEHFKPSALIFTGTAGALNPGQIQGDVVVGASTSHHDFGMLTAASPASPTGFAHWRTRNPITNEKNPLYFPADGRLLEAARRAGAALRLKKIDLGAGVREPRVSEGVIVTGDVFVGDRAKSQALRQNFNADAVEMEGAAVAQICWQYETPCLVVRSLSDRADGTAYLDYEKFVKVAAENSSALVAEMVSELRKLPPAATDDPRRWKLAFELAFGSDTPYSRKFPGFDNLPYEKKLAITREVLDRVVAVMLKEVGARRLKLEYLPGGFETFPAAPSAQLELGADEAHARDAMDVVGFLAQQSAVIASRRKHFGNRNALQVVQTAGDELATPDGVVAFWRRLSALAPKLSPGFSGLRERGRPGIYIIDTDDDWLPWDFTKFDEAVAAASKEAGVATAATHFRVMLIESTNAWKENPQGEQYLARLRRRGRASLAVRLATVYQPRVERWIAEAFRRHAPESAAARKKVGFYTRARIFLHTSPLSTHLNVLTRVRGVRAGRSR
jgi:adenosylhomocysteine nucleosidase